MIHLDEEEALFLRVYDKDECFKVGEYKKQEKIQSLLTENKGLLFTTEQFNEQTLPKVKACLEELKQEGFVVGGKMIAFQMPYDQYLTGEELGYLIEIEQYLQSNGAELVIEAEDLFNLSDIIGTNEKLEAEVDYINSLTVPSENNRPLNEIEKFLLAYDFCTNFKYNENNNNASKSRYITSILNGENIVCVGYAKLLSEICKRLGIECHSVSVSCFDERTKQKEGHQNNIVVIGNKTYYADACWDCSRAGDKGLKFYNFCLIPLADRNAIKGVKVEYNEFNNLPFAEEDLKIATNYLKQIETDQFDIEKCLNFCSKYSNVVGQIKVDLDCETNHLTYKEIINLREKIKAKKELETIISYLKVHQPGDSFDFETIEQALLNTYLAKGMTDRDAQSLLDRTMEINERRAKKNFGVEATNCFSVGRTEGLEV